MERSAATLARLVSQLTAPHRLLVRLHELAEPVIAGHGGAALELRERVKAIAAARPEAALAAAEKTECCCTPPSRIVSRAEPPPADSPGAIDDGALVRLAHAITAAFACDLEEQAKALDTVFGLVFLAAPFRAGPAANLRKVRRRIRASCPREPGICLKGLIKGPHFIDPELQDHRPADLFEPGVFVDFQRIRCQVQLLRALQARREPPPARPARVVWSDNITAIETIGACAGDSAIIRGTGFGSPKPPHVGIIVPILGVCTPMNVPASAWTNTTVRFTLPNGVTSGPIGFVDLAYVAAYNAWVDRMNLLRQQIIALAKCARAPRSSRASPRIGRRSRSSSPAAASR